MSAELRSAGPQPGSGSQGPGSGYQSVKPEKTFDQQWLYLNQHTWELGEGRLQVQYSNPSQMNLKNKRGWSQTCGSGPVTSSPVQVWVHLPGQDGG